MEDWLRLVLTSATVTVVLGGVAAALFKTLLTERLRAAIRAEYDAKLESHKAQLQSSNSKELEVLKAQLKGLADVELEQLKSQLQVQAAQQSMKFSRLHERRITAIDAVHAKLDPVSDAIGIYIAMFQPAGADPSAQLSAVETAYKDFKSAFAAHQLFLPRDIADAVEALDRSFVQITNQFTMVVRPKSNEPNVDHWMQLLQRFEGEVANARRHLQESMRLALGDAPPAA
ncbi:MAG: hypothetical protein KIT17_27740 [Rubrivivax sp.]|nr:hypothetical protein [Rubrivivax sp.]